MSLCKYYFSILAEMLFELTSFEAHVSRVGAGGENGPHVLYSTPFLLEMLPQIRKEMWVFVQVTSIKSIERPN